MRIINSFITYSYIMVSKDLALFNPQGSYPSWSESFLNFESQMATSFISQLDDICRPLMHVVKGVIPTALTVLCLEGTRYLQNRAQDKTFWQSLYQASDGGFINQHILTYLSKVITHKDGLLGAKKESMKGFEEGEPKVEKKILSRDFEALREHYQQLQDNPTDMTALKEFHKARILADQEKYPIFSNKLFLEQPSLAADVVGEKVSSNFGFRKSQGEIGSERKVTEFADSNKKRIQFNKSCSTRSNKDL